MEIITTAFTLFFYVVIGLIFAGLFLKFLYKDSNKDERIMLMVVFATFWPFAAPIIFGLAGIWYFLNYSYRVMVKVFKLEED